MHNLPEKRYCRKQAMPAFSAQHLGGWQIGKQATFHTRTAAVRKVGHAIFHARPGKKGKSRHTLFVFMPAAFPAWLGALN
ncbi:hypothetical protein P421_04770 [Heyndrickxia coagulans P38]|nr:hypothetical protein P421_04770 [Heyndrickxia coagulans P38]